MRVFALIVSLACVTQALAYGHGTFYLSPEEIEAMRPKSGPGAPRSGPAVTPPGGTRVSGPVGPLTPAASPAGQPAGGRASASVTGADTDASLWSTWWHFNRDPFLALKSHLFRAESLYGSDDFFLGKGSETGAIVLRPDPQIVAERVVPALLETLKTEENNDLRTAALIALARIGRTEGRRSFAGSIVPFLKDENLEVSETAALALGILGDASCVPWLVELLADSEPGRALCDAPEVPYRIRAFAAYGLGLVGKRTEDAYMRRKICGQLMAQLESADFATRDIEIACVNALSLVPLPLETIGPRDATAAAAREVAPHVISRRAQIGYLLVRMADQRGGRHWLVRAHIPIALGRLVQGASESTRGIVVQALTAPLLTRTSAEQVEVLEGLVIGLGRCANSGQSDVDREARGALERTIADGDPILRRFALIALARVASRPGQGDEPTEGLDAGLRKLESTLARGKTGLKPWAALALALLAHDVEEFDPNLHTRVADELRTALDGMRRPQDVGAYALAVGILRDLRGQDILIEKLDSFADDRARGYIAVALGLAQAKAATEKIEDVVAASKYRPRLLGEAAIALGLLGDKNVVPKLLAMMADANATASQAAIASALGLVGDARSIDPLLEMLGQKTQLTDTARAFAVVALGLVCDKDPLPWRSDLSVGCNYDATVSTLIGGGRGILEIL